MIKNQIKQGAVQVLRGYYRIHPPARLPLLQMRRDLCRRWQGVPKKAARNFDNLEELSEYHESESEF